MAETKKITKKEFYNIIEELCADRQDVVDFCKREKELLERKNSKSRTSKTQIENEKVSKILVSELEKVKEPITISDLMEKSQVVKDYVLENGKHLSNQKISSLLNKMANPENENSILVKVTAKGKSYFSVR